MKAVDLRALEDMDSQPQPARPVVPGWPDATIAELAGRQQTNVAYAQLRELGISSSAIDRARRRGRLHRVHRGVYSLVPAAARPQLADEHAALLACGSGAVLSHDSAAFLLGLAGRPRAVHVTIESGHHRSRGGLVVHRTRALPRAERTKVGRLWVTSIPRTVKDLARTLDDRPFERLIDEALRRVSKSKLTGVVSRADRVLTGDHVSTLTWSQAEELLRGMIARAGLPQPESNVALGHYRPDLLWREERVIVEYDSYKFHSGPASFHQDRDRHNDLTALDGYEVLHITGRQLRERPEQVLVWIATALARRRVSPAPAARTPAAA